MESEAVRVIVTRDDHLLVMHRIKHGREYYTLIGGHIEAGETPLQAMLREVDEETGIRLTAPRLVYEQQPTGQYNKQYVFVADDAGGDIALRPDSDEAALNRQGDNTYQPMWLSLTQLAGVPFLPSVLRDQLLHDIEHGFASEPISIKPEGVE